MKINNFGKRKDVVYSFGHTFVKEKTLKKLYLGGYLKPEDETDVYVNGKFIEKLKISDIYDSDYYRIS